MIASSTRYEMSKFFRDENFTEDEIYVVLGNWDRFSEINMLEATSEDLILEAELILDSAGFV